MKTLIRSILFISMLTLGMPHIVQAHKEEENVKVVYIEKNSTGRSVGMFVLGNLTMLLAVTVIYLVKIGKSGNKKNGISIKNPDTWTSEHATNTVKNLERTANNVVKKGKAAYQDAPSRAQLVANKAERGFNDFINWAEGNQ